MVWESMAGGIPEADGIMERGGGFLYGDHPGGVPDFHRLFFCDPGLVERPVVAGIRVFHEYLERDPTESYCPAGGYNHLISVENAKNTLQGIWSGSADCLRRFELLKNVILAPVLLLIDLVTGNFSQLASDAANIWNNIKNAAAQIWSGIRQVVTSAASD